MPRDSSGTYSFPASAKRPVTSGTTIDSTAQNALEADIQSALTDSLSRSGNGGMTAAFRNADGVLAAPGITWTNETGSGVRRATSNEFRQVIAGEDFWGWLKSAGVKLFKSFVADGASAVAWILDTSGAYSTSGAKLLSLRNNGSEKFSVDKDGVVALSSTISGMTRASLPTVGQQTSSASGAFSTSSGSWTDVTNLSVSITTTGRPVILAVQPGTAGTGYFTPPTNSLCTVNYRILRGATPIAVWGAAVGTNSAFAYPASMVVLDAPGAGTYTYKVQAMISGAANPGGVNDAVLVAYEL